VKVIFFDSTPENLSKEGISEIFSTPCKYSVEILTVFGSTCCCWSSESSPPASYSKCKNRAPTWLILQF